MRNQNETSNIRFEQNVSMRVYVYIKGRKSKTKKN